MEQILNADVYGLCDKLERIVDALNDIHGHHFEYDCNYFEIINDNIVQSIYTCVLNYKGNKDLCIFRIYYNEDLQSVKCRLFKQNTKGMTDIFVTDIEDELDLDSFLDFTLFTIEILFKMEVLN